MNLFKVHQGKLMCVNIHPLFKKSQIEGVREKSRLPEQDPAHLPYFEQIIFKLWSDL